MTKVGPDLAFQTALLDALDESVIVTDRAGIVVACNAAAERTYGRGAAQIVGRSAFQLVAEESSEQAQAMHATVLAGQSWSGDIVATRQDGSTFPVLVTGAPVLDGVGEVTGILGLSYDVSARREAEEVAQTFLSLVSSSADAIFTKDLDGHILTWNRGAEHLYGYLADDVIGRHVSVLDPDPTSADGTLLLKAAAAGQTVQGREATRRRRDGSIVDVSLTVSPIFGATGEVTAASVIGRDVSERRQFERQLARQATHDDLTGLPNRLLLEDRLQQAIVRSARRKVPLSVLFVSLDRLGQVNASHGYVVGDQLLAEVAARLHATIGEGDTVGRVGGDEFVIVAEEIAVDEAQQLAQRVAAALDAPLELSGIQVATSASIGIAVTPPLRSDTLLRYAQTATLDAKARGGARSQIFSIESVQGWTDRVELGRELGDALSSDQLEVHYQPVVELRTGDLLGIEALVRWNHPTRGWVSPGFFVRLAEDTGLISQLDLWVMQRAVRDAAAFRRAGVIPAEAYLAVNVSALNVSDPELVNRISEAATGASFPLTSLELEVTETGLMTDRRAASRALSSLRALGVGVALDDFGMGYSPFTYLRQLPVSAIKIDRTFVRHITVRADDLAIAASVVDLGRAVGLRTIAEGIETPEQLSVLHRLGCVAGQGFLWSPALPARDLVTFARRSEQLVRAKANAPFKPVSKRGTPVTNEHGLHRMLQLHREGASLATIAAGLNAEGYASPSHQRWHSASVARVIADAAQSADR